jgi:hypothetical protein
VDAALREALGLALAAINPDDPALARPGPTP